MHTSFLVWWKNFQPPPMFVWLICGSYLDNYCLLFRLCSQWPFLALIQICNTSYNNRLSWQQFLNCIMKLKEMIPLTIMDFQGRSRGDQMEVRKRCCLFSANQKILHFHVILFWYILYIKLFRNPNYQSGWDLLMRTQMSL